MAIVVKHEILESIKNGELKFTPALDSLQFRPHAVDLRLGTTFRVPRRTFNVKRGSKGRTAVPLDHMAVNNGHFAVYDEIDLKPGQYFDILPGEWIMGFTMEKVHIKSNTLMGVLYPRSSVNRRGLAVDLTGIVDTGYNGRLMIPIHNTTSMQVIRVWPGERICQLVLERLEQPVREGYQGRYFDKKKKIAGTYVPEKENREIELIRSGDLKTIKKEFKQTAR
ncbi:MAG TPA: dCTP deaminase [Candidatus Saccharimonadales bacterium]|nr:dCTP deaminase [Candidatus Saccharimonadales bacterium]